MKLRKLIALLALKSALKEFNGAMDKRNNKRM